MPDDEDSYCFHTRVVQYSSPGYVTGMVSSNGGKIKIGLEKVYLPHGASDPEDRKAEVDVVFHDWCSVCDGHTVTTCASGSAPPQGLEVIDNANGFNCPSNITPGVDIPQGDTVTDEDLFGVKITEDCPPEAYNLYVDDTLFEDVVWVVDASIKIADGQKGVIGDEVESTESSQPDHWRHFVTPKASAGDNVYLEAELVPDELTEEEAKAAFNALFEWDGDGACPEDDPLTRYVVRAPASENEVRILLQTDASDVRGKMRVWVVWATITPTADQSFASATTTADPDNGGPRPTNTWVAPESTRYRFVATIKPKSIIDGSATWGDIPALDGVATQAPPGGASFAGGATKRWDMSRRIRRKWVDSSNSLVTDDIWGTDAQIEAIIAMGLPESTAVINSYPEDTLHGNDDRRASDEENNPYSASESIPDTAGPTKPAIGKLGSADRPNSPYIDEDAAHGAVGDTLEVRLQFGEFARLQIGDNGAAGYTNWYVISDFSDWRQHIEYIKGVDGRWSDNDSVQATDNAGF